MNFTPVIRILAHAGKYPGNPGRPLLPLAILNAFAIFSTAACDVNPSQSSSESSSLGPASPVFAPSGADPVTPTGQVSSASPSPPGTAATEGTLVARINAGTLQLLPRADGKPAIESNDLFTNYQGARPKKVTWSRGWTWQIDFSGVAWEKRQSLTMVSPIHGIMAKHYRRKVGSSVVFHTREGNKVLRKVAATQGIPGVDLTVAILDRPVPNAIRHYRVLPPSDRYATTLVGAYALVTNQFRKVQIHQVRGVVKSRANVWFGKAERLPAAAFKALIKGDSGNPSFLWVRGEPVFIETHSGGGAGVGPFLSLPGTFKAINQTMKELSEMKSLPVYQLRAVRP